MTYKKCSTDVGSIGRAVVGGVLSRVFWAVIPKARYHLV